MNSHFARILILPLSLIILSCASSPQVKTLKNLPVHEVDIEEPVAITTNRETAIQNYKNFIQSTDDKTHYGEALRRLADIELEHSEYKQSLDSAKHLDQAQVSLDDAIQHYQTYLSAYPGDARNDLILYQLARAYTVNGRYKEAMTAMDTIVSDYPDTRYLDEVQFRRGEILFITKEYREAEIAYNTIVSHYKNSTFYEKAVFKLAWSQFKQSRYDEALENFLSILDDKQSQGKLTAGGLTAEVTEAEADFINDTLRVVSLSLSYQEGAASIERLFKNQQGRIYEALLYRHLAQLFLKKQRISDAAEVYLRYAKQHPNKALAAEFHSLAISAYETGNFHDLALNTKKSFVTQYSVNTVFWTKQTEASRQAIKPLLVKHISELANYYHSIAQKSKKKNDYLSAGHWYKTYLQSFPQANDAASINFLLAESYFSAKDFSQALTEYEKTAYQYPGHNKSAEAGFAALLTYKILIDQAKPDRRTLLESSAISSAIRFGNQFPNDKRAPEVTVRTAEDLYNLKQYTLASELAMKIIKRQDIQNQKLLRSARIIDANARYELKDYVSAELAFTSLINDKTNSKKQVKEYSDKIAVCIYKQAEQFKISKQYELAAQQFLRVGVRIPNSSLRAAAEYDAATMYITLEQWKKASQVLEQHRITFPKLKKYRSGITEKLALCYSKTGQYNKAAIEIYALSKATTDPVKQKDLIWLAAESYDKAGVQDKAIILYKAYIKKSPQPFAQNIEAHLIIAEYYRAKKQTRKWYKELHTLLKTEQNGGNQRTERTQFLAANAALSIAHNELAHFKSAKLTVPLKKSLKRKKALMQKALKSYATVLSYQIAELSTAATYQVAEIYHDFALGLLNSQRPKGLGDEELEQYDILLEEQAYPFEEKSIEIHSSNTIRTKDGIYDKWIKNSLKVLAEFEPIRYAKKERIQPYAP